MLEIDGSLGEGGGQVLRSALSLSCLLNRSFRIYNIRKGRKKPGLMPQHLACVRALRILSDAAVEGEAVGGTEFSFTPGRIRGGDYSFAIGTAGSTSLLLQALLPPLVFAGEPSSLLLTGGTHVPFSPPFHYIEGVFLPALGRLGIAVRAEIESYGFYPRGGGRIRVTITPAGGASGGRFLERGELGALKGISVVGNLPMSIAERQREALLVLLASRGYHAEMETCQVSTPGHGTFVFLKAEAENCSAGFSSIGELGKRAETVGSEAAQRFLDYFATGACLDPHLADQLVLYLALAGGDSSFTTSRISSHLLTNLQVVERFLGTRYAVEGEIGEPGRVTIQGRPP